MTACPARWRTRGPLCLGIDPHPELLSAWGLSTDADGLARFSDICVAAFAGFAVVKPQVAFFEAYGSAGYAVLERTIAALRDAGVLVLADAKRGDIGSTMAAYADAWAGDSPLACRRRDGVAVSGLRVAAAAAGQGAGPRPRGVRAGRDVQPRGRVGAARARPADAPSRSRSSTRRRRSTVTARPGSVGVVVGATLTDPPDVSALDGPVLVPGVGAQGGRPEALAGLGGALPGQLLPAVSREVLRAGPDIAALRGGRRADARRRRLPRPRDRRDRLARRRARSER